MQKVFFIIKKICTVKLTIFSQLTRLDNIHILNEKFII